MSQEHNLVLILARGLAQSIATPIFIVDPDGTLVYFNEPAERVLGASYATEGEMTRDEWGTIFEATDPQTGESMDTGSMPLGIALAKREPAHREMTITAKDGIERRIAVTAFPLFARTDEFVGAIAIFWEAS